MEHSVVTIASLRTLRRLKTEMSGHRVEVFAPTNIFSVLCYLICSSYTVHDSYW